MRMSSPIKRVPCKVTLIGRRSFSCTPFPDKVRLELGLKNKMSFHGLTYKIARRHPTVLANYWRIAQTMQQRGLIPLVHGQPVLWMVPQKVLKALGYEDCGCLRAPGAVTQSSHEVRQRIDAVLRKQQENWARWCLLYRFPKLTMGENQLDHQPEFQVHLLATTLGAFHDEIDESPFSFVFGGESGSKYLVMEGNRSVLNQRDSLSLADHMITAGMSEKGYTLRQIEEVLKRVQPFYEQANKMAIGQLLVIGVPEISLEKMAYQSKPYGIPTGKPLKQLIDKSEHVMRSEYQVRLILGSECMNSDSKIKMVNVMDEKEVENYCSGTLIGDPWDDPVFRKFMNLAEDIPLEEANNEFRRFLERLEEVIKNVL